MDPAATDSITQPPLYDFDPSHGYSLDQLLKVQAPKEPADFKQFWTTRYERAQLVKPAPILKDTQGNYKGWRVFDLAYTSTDNFPIQGWLLLPESSEPKRGFIVGHGYTNREEPDYHLPFQDAAILFPCFRGLGRSQRPPISNEVKWHVLHDIDKPDRYIIGGCVEDVWMAVSALLRLFPHLAEHIGYLGTSLGGGVGSLATAWDSRIKKCHLNVPTFGNHPLRLTLANVGSGASLQSYYKLHGNEALKTLQYYDAATAAGYITSPVHCALAPYDPYVPPAGQFAIYNNLAGPKKCFLLTAGHHPHAHEKQEEVNLVVEIKQFFQDL